MAGPYHGKTGNVNFDDGNIIHLQNWSVNSIGETVEQTGMGDSFAVHDEGLLDFNGTADGLSQKALDTVALLGTEGDCEFIWETAGATLEGNAILTGITETVSHEGNGTIAYTFEGSDETGLVIGTTGVAPTATSDSFHGKECNADSGGPIEGVRGWTVALSVSVADATAAHDTNRGRTKLAGIISGTATLVTISDGTYQITPGAAAVTLKLNRTATPADGFYEGSAICTGAEPGIDKDGVGIMTYSFIYTGTIDLKVA